MSVAVCKSCGRHWRWTQRPGTRLDNLHCTACKGELRKLRSSGPHVDMPRLSFKIGTQKKTIVKDLKELMSADDSDGETRKMAADELAAYDA